MSSFDEMKKIKQAFNYRLFLHPIDDHRTIVKDGMLLRSGKAGESKQFFSRKGAYAFILLSNSLHMVGTLHSRGAGNDQYCGRRFFRHKPGSA